MKREIHLEVGGFKLEAELYDSKTADKIWSLLPLKAVAETWGDEIYFTIPVEEKLDETARDVVEIGELGYWPEGPAFCIFFGPTPISKGKEIRPASSVNIVGRVKGDPTILKGVSRGEAVRIEAKLSDTSKPLDLPNQ